MRHKSHIFHSEDFGDDGPKHIPKPNRGTNKKLKIPNGKKCIESNCGSLRLRIPFRSPIMMMMVV